MLGSPLQLYFLFRMNVEDFECLKVRVLAFVADPYSTKLQAKGTRKWLFHLFLKIEGLDYLLFKVNEEDHEHSKAHIGLVKDLLGRSNLQQDRSK